MKRIRLVLAALLLAGLALVTEPALAGGFFVGIRIAPPPPRHEVVVVRHRPGYVWVRGHWAWHPRWHRYVWMRGVWIPARRGYVWVDGCWTRTDDGWAYREGYFAR